MQGPHLVARKAPIAVKFEGGEENASPIVSWIRSNGHESRWMEASLGRGEAEEKISVEWDKTSVFASKYMELRPGYWLVWEAGNYTIMSEEHFHILYDDKEPFKDFVERHLGEDAQHTYVSRELTVKALQMPTQKENEASKDLEERVRAVAQFIDANGGQVYDFALNYISATLEGSDQQLEPGEWVVLDFTNTLDFMSHERFRLFYKSAEEAS
jgi:hypothetical protein